MSTDTGTPAAANRSITGAIRLISSPSHSLGALGRVDSPPTSISAAPAAAIAKPASAAACGSPICLPPSEKLSGVMLRIAITWGASKRMVRSPATSGGRWAEILAASCKARCASLSGKAAMALAKSATGIVTRAMRRAPSSAVSS